MKITPKSPLPDAIPAKIFMPVLLSMFLFIGTFFGYILPKVEAHLMDRKREMIYALSESAMSSIRYYAELSEKTIHLSGGSQAAGSIAPAQSALRSAG